MEVKIVTGKINSGKTSRIRQYYQSNPIGEGIISRKIMIDRDVFGYYALRLSDNFEFPLMIHEKFFDRSFYIERTFSSRSIGETIGPYKVYKKALKAVREILTQAIKKGKSPIYLDEVGMLELSDKGFASIIRLAKRQDVDLVMSIREDLVESVMQHFQLNNYEIVSR